MLSSWSTAQDVLLWTLITGAYPAIAWMPLVFAWMALGRIDWTAVRNQYRLLATGIALTVAGYGGSRLLLDGSASDYTWLLTSSPHSGMSFEIIGGTAWRSW